MIFENPIVLPPRLKCRKHKPPGSYRSTNNKDLVEGLASPRGRRGGAGPHRPGPAAAGDAAVLGLPAGRGTDEVSAMKAWLTRLRSGAMTDVVDGQHLWLALYRPRAAKYPVGGHLDHTAEFWVLSFGHRQLSVLIGWSREGWH